MGRRNYQYEKRMRELAKKKIKEEKRQRKLARKQQEQEGQEIASGEPGVVATPESVENPPSQSE